MKQTAVEWLREKLWREFNFSFSDNIFNQAKEMEKQQQGYSEEEVLQLIDDFSGNVRQAKEWFEQFKKK